MTTFPNQTMTAFADLTIHRRHAGGTTTIHRCVSPVEARVIVTEYIRDHGLRRVKPHPADYSKGVLLDGDVEVGYYTITPRQPRR